MEKNKDQIINWVKVLLLFLIQSLVNYIYLKLAVFVIVIIEKYIFSEDVHTILSSTTLRSVCLVIGIYMAAKTKYYLGKNVYVIWSGSHEYFKDK